MKDKFILNKDNLIIPKYKSNTITSDILSRLSSLLKQKREHKESLSHIKGQLIQISKQINEINEEIETKY